MAGSSLFTLIDDIASLLDDVSVMSKVALKKTAGVVGDDLALNAEQVTGVRTQRELPVVWAVAKGSLKNKAILVPAAMLISWLTPWAIMPLLMLGGLFLCYEGVHKILHSFHKKHPKSGTASAHAEARATESQLSNPEELRALADPTVDMVAWEKEKISGAIRTDFILSAEIIVITLGQLTESTLAVRLLSLIAVAVLITVGVYGLVAAIVKLDDLGLHLSRKEGEGMSQSISRAMGGAILWSAPKLMRFLSIAGTTAMFLVGGGIIVHTFEGSLGAQVHHIEEAAQNISALLGHASGIVIEGLIGIVAGVLVVAAVGLFAKLVRSARPAPTDN